MVVVEVVLLLFFILVLVLLYSQTSIKRPHKGNVKRGL